MFQNQTTNVKGTVTEQDSQLVENVFGKELSDKLDNSTEGTLFLNLLFSHLETKN